MARSVGDLALSYDCMQGADPDDPAQSPRPLEPVSASLDAGAAGLRIARASGFFEDAADESGVKAVEAVCSALGVTARAHYPEPLRARAAAFLITMSEGASLHLETLRARTADYDPDVRERLMAGALLPAAWIQKAQKFRRWHASMTARMFEDIDVLIAPATPCQAPKLGQKTFMLAAPKSLSARISAFSPAVFVHWSARRQRSNLARWREPADRRPADRGSVAGEFRVACRPRP